MLYITSSVIILLVIQENFIVVEMQYNHPDYFDHDVRTLPELNVEYYIPEMGIKLSDNSLRAKRNRTTTGWPTLTYLNSTFFVILDNNSSDIYTTTPLPTLPSNSTSDLNKTNASEASKLFNKTNASDSSLTSSQSSIAITIPATNSTSSVVTTITSTVTIPLRENTVSTLATTTSKEPTSSVTVPIPDIGHSELEYAQPVSTTTTTTPAYEEAIEYEELTTDPFSKSLENLFKILGRMNETQLDKFVRSFERHLHKKVMDGFFHKYGEVINTYVEENTLKLQASVFELQRVFAMGYHQLRTRRKSLANDLNSMLDYIDMLYGVPQETRMQEILNDTAMYPNTSKTVDEITKSLLTEGFLQPMQMVSGTAKGNILFASMTKVIQDRDPKKYIQRRKLREYRDEQDEILNRQIKSIGGYKERDRRFKFPKDDDDGERSSNYLFTRKYKIKVTESKKPKYSYRDKNNIDESVIVNKNKSFKKFDEKDIKHKSVYSHRKKKPDAHFNDINGVATTVRKKDDSLTTLAKNDVRTENIMKRNEENKTLGVSDKDTDRNMRVKLGNILGGNIYYNKINLDRNRKGRHKEFGRDRRLRETQFHVTISSTVKPTRQSGFASERMKPFRNNNYNSEYTQYSREPSSNTNNYVEQKMENSPKAVSTTKRFHSYKPKAVNNSNSPQFSVKTLPDTTPFKFFRLSPETQDNNDKTKNNKLLSVVPEFGDLQNIIDFSMKVQLKNPMKQQRHKYTESDLIEKENNAKLRERPTTSEQRTLNPYKMDKYFVSKVTPDPGVWYISEKPPPNSVDDVPYDIYAVSVEAGRNQNLYNKLKDKKQSHNRKQVKEHLRKRHKRKRDKHRKRHKHGKHRNKKHRSRHHHAHLKKKRHKRKRPLRHNLRTHNNKQINKNTFESPLVQNEEKKKRYNVIVTPKATYMEANQMENNENVLMNRARAINPAKVNENVNSFTNDIEKVFEFSAYSTIEHEGKDEHNTSSESSYNNKENTSVEIQLMEEKDYVISEQDTSQNHAQNKMENFPKNTINKKGTETNELKKEKANYLKNTNKAIRIQKHVDENQKNQELTDDKPVNSDQRNGIQNPKHKTNEYLSKKIQNNKITPFKTKVNKNSVVSERHSVNHFKKEKSIKNIDDLAGTNRERSNNYTKAYYSYEDHVAKRIHKIFTTYATKTLKKSTNQDNAMNYSENKKKNKSHYTHFANSEQANENSNNYNGENSPKRLRKNKITNKTNIVKDFIKSDRNNLGNDYRNNNKNNNDDLDSAISEQNNKYKDSVENQSDWIQKNKSKHHKSKDVKTFSNSDEDNSVEGYKKENTVHDDIDFENREYINNSKETKSSNEDFRRNINNKKGIVNLMQDSAYSDDEKELKKNLYDAFRHGDGIDYRKRMRHEVPLAIGLREEPVYTDNEAVLKRRIYEVINGENSRKSGQFA